MHEHIQTYILKYPDGAYAALESTSGGYPYPTNNIFEAQRWSNFNELLRYTKMFPALQVYKLEIYVEDTYIHNPEELLK